MNFPEDRSKWHPITWVIIVIGILAVLVAIGLPGFIKYRESAAQRACIRNLQMIEAGKQQWESEHAGSATRPAREDAAHTPGGTAHKLAEPDR